jgi:hypothetical protein
MAGEYARVTQILESNKDDAISSLGEAIYYQYLAMSYFNLNQYDKCLEILLYIIKNLDVKKYDEIFSIMTNYIHWYINNTNDLNLTNQNVKAIYDYVTLNCTNESIKTRLETVIVLKKLVVTKRDEKKQWVDKLQGMLPAIESDLDEFPQIKMSVYTSLVKYYKETDNEDLAKQFQEKVTSMLNEK